MTQQRMRRVSGTINEKHAESLSVSHLLVGFSFQVFSGSYLPIFFLRFDFLIFVENMEGDEAQRHDNVGR